jgi:hypothetical protein
MITLLKSKIIKKNILAMKISKKDKIKLLLDSGLNMAAAFLLVKGDYQKSIIFGKSMSLSRLKGKARDYASKYKASQNNLIARLQEFNIIFEKVNSCLEIPTYNINIIKLFKTKKRYKNCVKKRVCNI